MRRSKVPGQIPLLKPSHDDQFLCAAINRVFRSRVFCRAIFFCHMVTKKYKSFLLYQYCLFRHFVIS